MVRGLLVLGLVGLAGCWVGSEQVARKVRDVDVDTDSDSDSDSDSDPGPLEIRGIDPEYGVDSGGTVVTIDAGVLLTDDVEVTFGGVPATIRTAEVDRVIVEAPAVGLEGAVDVVVSSGERSERLTGGFFYWADGSDRAGLIGTVSNYDFDRPYLSDDPQQRRAVLYYVDPIEFEWWHLYAGQLDACVRDYRRDGAQIDILQPGLDSLVLDNGLERVVLGPDADGESYGTDLQTGWFANGQRFELSHGAGDPGWPEITIDAVADMPDAGFRVTSPSIDSSYLAIRDGGFDLRWSGGTSGDVILVSINRYNFLGDLQDEVTCALVDDGAHFVPDSVWSGWSFTGTLTFMVGRAQSSPAKLPWNHADTRVVGIQWFYGEGYQD